MRFHLGAAVWRTSFGSWPLLPMIDRRFLEVAIDLPPATLSERKLERRLLVQRFPTLARIPLDGNSLRFDPIKRGPVGHAWSLVGRVLPARRLWQRWAWRGVERRRYWRRYDVNGPSWRAVRRRAEPMRGKLEAWLNRQEVDRLLPPPEDTIALKDPFGAGASRRTLLGLMLWAKDHPC